MLTLLNAAYGCRHASTIVQQTFRSCHIWGISMASDNTFDCHYWQRGPYFLVHNFVVVEY